MKGRGHRMKMNPRLLGLMFVSCGLFYALSVCAAGTAAEPPAAGGEPVAAPPAEPRWQDWTVQVKTPIPNTSSYAWGSGFVVSPSGYVISNRHVIEVQGDRQAIFADGRAYPLRLVAAPRHLDLALLKIDADRKFAPLPLGRSSEVKVGQPTFATGNPGGSGLKISRGAITAIGTGWIWGGPYSEQMIGFNAPISGGNSGGPLVNRAGEGIGVVFCVAEGVSNLSFAVPMDGTLEFLRKTLDEQGHFNFHLGMEVAPYGAATITGVAAAGPAQRAGIKSGDIVAQVDDRVVRQGFDFHLALLDRRSGEKLRLKLLRQGKPFEVTVELDKRPPVPPAAAQDRPVAR